MIKRIFAAALATTMLASAPAKASWVEASSQHFLVLGDMSTDQAKNWATKLERMDKVLRLVTHTPEPEAGKLGRVTVFIVPDMDSVQKLYGGGSGDVGGYYRADAQMALAFAPRGLPSYMSQYVTPQQILIHEYTHHILLSSTAGYYPDWIQEGFAEYFSTAKELPNGTLVLGAPPKERGFSLMENYRLTVPELLSTSERSKNRGDVQDLYARSWLLIHLLMSKPERAGQLDKYLKLIDAGRPSVDAGREAFGDLGKLDAEMLGYIHAANFKGIYVPPEKVAIGPVSVRTLPRCEAQIMPIRMVSANGVNDKTAPTVVADARRVAASCADDAFVQRTLTEAEFDAKNNDASLAAAGRTLQIDPQNVMAMIYTGRIAARKGKWDEARQWFAKANRAEPGYALPLVLYSDTYPRSGQPMPTSAVDGLMRAVVLVPQDPAVRLRVARALIKEGDLKTAKTVILPVAHGTDGKGNAGATKVVSLIDSGAKPEAVLAEADKAKWNEIGKE